MKVIYLGSNTREEIEKRIQVVATAGALSRSSGTVTQVYESHYNYEKNLKLAKAVVGHGHKSIAEHDYLVYALENVTPIIEQIIIGYRLTSFTIKSRRNVGFYIPNFIDSTGNILVNNNKLQEEYRNYMQSLFNQYGDLVDSAIPVEDCRYILPYSYYSNIIMGCDANEFLNMTCDMLYGKISKITEVRELGEKFAEMIETYVPYLWQLLAKEEYKSYYEDKLAFVDKLINKVGTLDVKLLDKVEMTDFSNSADYKVILSSLMARYQCSYSQGEKLLS